MSLFGSIQDAVEAALKNAVDSLTRKDAEQDTALAALEVRVKALEEASTGSGSGPQTAARGRSVKAKASPAAGGADAPPTGA